MGKKFEIYGLKILEDITSETNLPKLIVEEAKAQVNGIEQDDVIVITSKIISKAEGRIYKLSDIKPSHKARFFSKLYKTSPELMELYLREGKIRAVIPIEKLIMKQWHLFKECVKDEDVAKSLIEKKPYAFLIEINNRLYTWGGIDESNAPPGYCTLLPKDPDESARRIREEIKKLTGKNTAVVIADTEWKLDKFGTTDIAIGSSGIQPVSRNFGSKDLYGKPKFGGVDDLTNLVSAAANLLYGQTNESIPIVIIRGLKYEKSEKGIKDVTYSWKALREGLRLTIWESIRFKLLSMLLAL